mmetsp:Transcript_39414/g.156503  ORF Transcript_39414/g.156503 Transcript_39414/m.156503 type:complete len:139 (-) Transcript_39414:579-995(-)
MLRTQSCVYRREKCLLAVYVDDMLIMGSEGDVETTEKMLSGLYNIKHLGAAGNFLGVRIERDRERREIHISQGDYIRKLTHTYGLKGCRTLSTPVSISHSAMRPCWDLERIPTLTSVSHRKLWWFLYCSTDYRADIFY